MISYALDHVGNIILIDCPRANLISKLQQKKEKRKAKTIPHSKKEKKKKIQIVITKNGDVFIMASFGVPYSFWNL